MRSFASTGTLLRFMLRRDRFRLPVWVLANAGLLATSAQGLRDIYPTQADLEKYATTVSNSAAAIAMQGPGFGIDTRGGQLAFETGLYAMIIAALMSMFTVGRHTRSEEEAGRVELLRAGAVGRHAVTTAALILATSANVALGAVIAGSVIGAGYPVAGSLLFGASIAVAGMVFAGFTVVAAQLSEHGRAVYGIVGAVIGISYTVRAIGDVGNGTLSWLSPFGWSQYTKPFVSDRWWTLLVAIVCTIALMTIAFALSVRRDVGAGILPARPGNPNAPSWMTRPIGFAWRLQRGSLIGWAVGVFTLAVAYGSFGQDVQDLADDNEAIRDVIASAGAADLVDSYFAYVCVLLALLSTGFAIQSALRLRTEESAGRAEVILASAVGRLHWYLAHVMVAVSGTFAMLTVAGLGVGITHAFRTRDVDNVWQLLGAQLSQTPAVLVLCGVAFATFGLAPRLAGVAWAALGLCVILGMFGQLLDLPSWTNNISPYAHVPQMPVANFNLLPLLMLSIVAVSMAATGGAGYRHRDAT